MKLEFNSIEELTEFYKKYIEQKQEVEIKVPEKEQEQKRDLVLQTQKNNKIDSIDLKKILFTS